MSTIIGRLIAGAAAIVMIGAASGNTASAATAPGNTDPVTPQALVSCAAPGTTFSVFLNPGILTLTPRNTTITTRIVFTNCTNATFTEDTSARIEFKLSPNNFTCVSLLLPLNLPTFKINWRSGATSTVTGGVQQVVGPTVVMTGNITAGRYNGSTLTISLTGFPVTAPAECLVTPPLGNYGVTDITGAAVTTIV